MKKFYTLGLCILSLAEVVAQQSAKNNFASSIQRAVSLFMAGDWENARREYEGILDQNQNNVVALNRLAFSCQHLGDYDQAIKYYMRTLNAQPSLPVRQLVYSRLAKAYMKKDQQANAIVALDSSVTIGFNNFNDLDTASEFVSLHSDGRFKQLVQKAKTNAFPCMADPHNREFDFWVGEWNAFVTGTNNLAGYSSIQKASGDCMILENWTSARVPFNGKSMNFIDPVTNKWEQVWVGSDGRGNHVGRFINGEYKENVMRFEFETPDAQGKKLMGRFSFFNEGPQQVRQLNETSADGGKTWTTVYDFTYKRIK